MKRNTQKVHAGHNVFLNLANKNVDYFFFPKSSFYESLTPQKPSVATEDNGNCLCGRKKGKLGKKK